MLNLGKNISKFDILYKLNILFSFMILSIFIHYGLVLLSALGILYFFKYKFFRELIKEKVLKKKSFCVLTVIIIFSIIRAIIWKNLFGIMAILILLWIAVCIIYYEIQDNNFKKQNISKLPVYSLIPFFTSAIEFLFTGHRAGYFFFFNPNYLGNVMMMCFLYNLNMMLKKEKSPLQTFFKNKINEKIIWLFILILNTLTIIVSGSRSAIIATIIGSMYLLYKKIQKRYFLLVIILFIVYVCGIIIGDLPFLRMHSFQKYLHLRIDIIKMAFIIFSRTNFWLGTGNFYYYKFTNHVYPHSHNVLIEIVLSYGVIGAIVLAVIFIHWLITEISSQKDKSFFIAFLIAVFIHNFTDLTIMWIQTSLLFVVIISSGVTKK